MGINKGKGSLVCFRLCGRHDIKLGFIIQQRKQKLFPKYQKSVEVKVLG